MPGTSGPPLVASWALVVLGEVDARLASLLRALPAGGTHQIDKICARVQAGASEDGIGQGLKRVRRFCQLGPQTRGGVGELGCTGINLLGREEVGRGVVG